MLHTFLTQACRSCVWADWVQFHSVPELGEQMGDLESYFPPISDPVLNPDQHLRFPSHHPHSRLLARLILFSPFQPPQGDVVFISTRDCYRKFPVGKRRVFGPKLEGGMEYLSSPLRRHIQAEWK